MIDYRLMAHQTRSGSPLAKTGGNVQSVVTDTGLAGASHIIPDLWDKEHAAALTPEDLLVLLANIRNVFSQGDPARHLVPDEALPLFMTHCNKRIGEAYFRTPRNTIKAFVQLLAVLEQNPGQGWSELIGGVDVANDAEGAALGREATIVCRPDHASITELAVEDGALRLIGLGVEMNNGEVR